MESGRVFIVLIALAAGMACGGPRLQESGFTPRYTDLLRLFDERQRTPGPEPEIMAWTVRGDTRSVLVQPTPGRIELGPIPSASNCVFRFGVTVAEQSWVETNGFVFRIAVKQGGVEQAVFEEVLDTQRSPEPSWWDRQVSIPELDSDGFFIVLQADSDPVAGQPASVAWSSPHMVCEVATSAPADHGRPHVILISIDTLRQDHLGLYGYPRSTSPTLDALAGESLVFENCFAPAPYTLPSHASMFTGLYPEEHGAGHGHQNVPLAADRSTIAELLRDSGYRTVAFTGGGLISRASGLAQGFGRWTERWTGHHRANLRSMLPAVLDALARPEDSPVFLFLHTYDVHGPYEQPEDARFFDADEYSSSMAAEEWERLVRSTHHRYQKLDRFGGLAEVVAAYDSGIRFVDSELGNLLNHLKKTGIYEDSLIIVTSDHGESLFEHGRYVSHGHTLHDAEVRVPLIVKLPGSAEIGRRDDFVQLTDVAPLILDRARVRSVGRLSGRNPLDGARSDLEAVRGETAITGALYVRSRQWKVISPTGRHWARRSQNLFEGMTDRFDSGWQIYDQIADPAESDNLFGKLDEIPPEIRHLVRRLQAVDSPGKLVGDEPPIDGDMAEALRSLGYL